jgi:hypothetical protein
VSTLTTESDSEMQRTEGGRISCRVEIGCALKATAVSVAGSPVSGLLTYLDACSWNGGEESTAYENTSRGGAVGL